MEFDPLAIKSGFEMVKGAIDTLKSVRDVLPPKAEARNVIDEKLKLAEREVALGEAQIAQALDYKLCRAHFPPVPMLKNRVHPTYVEEISKCPQCAAEEPSPEHFAQKDDFNRKVDAHNTRMRHKNSWMT